MLDRLRRDLTAALRTRDRVAIAALRSAPAAVDNAGARPAGPPSGDGEHVAGAARGVDAAEADRLLLTDADVCRIIGTEVAERSAAAQEYERLDLAEGYPRRPTCCADTCPGEVGWWSLRCGVRRLVEHGFDPLPEVAVPRSCGSGGI